MLIPLLRHSWRATRFVLLAAASTFWSAPAAAQQAGGGAGDALALTLERRLLPAREKGAAVPVFVTGQKISGETGSVTTVEGDAELRKQDSQIKAERITYRTVEDELTASGAVRVVHAGDLFTGPELRLKLDAQTGHFLDVEYLLANHKARGNASRIDFLGPDNYRADNARYTTCGPGNDDWFMQVKELKLDYGRDVGEAEEARLYFLGRQIAYVPGMSFSLNDRRKSGFLAPSFGSSIQSGQEISTPYYWNIAPNRDMTITPRYMSKRGLQANAAMRYLGEDYRGEVRGEVLPNDQLTGTTRSGFNLLHQQTLPGGVRAFVNFNKVSDDTYFTDLSNRISATSQTFLPRDANLSYSTALTSLYVRTLSYQTLQDPLNPVISPYRRLPQVVYSARRSDLGGFDLALGAEFNRFTHPTLVVGNRTVVSPSISYPMLSPGAYLIPKVSFHATNYQLGNTAVGTPDSFTRTLPIVSIDSGMSFERPARYLGQDYTQTLEPRVYYLKVPVREQSQIPIFDTALADFNLAQVFSENIYSGADRIADANQLTAAVTSRLLGSNNGNERVRVTLGQRFYFTEQRVTLPGEVGRSSRSSDIIAAFSGEIAPKLALDTTLQYNPQLREIARISHGVRYMPEPGKTFSAAYRYRRDFLEQIDVAGQWKFGGGWNGVGRYNYSLREGRVVEALGGVEYDGGCWVGRVVMQRFATATQKASTGIFFQLELNGLSSLGSNPLETLRRNIPGYSRLNDSQQAQPRTFENYE